MNIKNSSLTTQGSRVTDNALSAYLFRRCVRFPVRKRWVLQQVRRQSGDENAAEQAFCLIRCRQPSLCWRKFVHSEEKSNPSASFASRGHTQSGVPCQVHVACRTSYAAPTARGGGTQQQRTTSPLRGRIHHGNHARRSTGALRQGPVRRVRDRFGRRPAQRLHRGDEARRRRRDRLPLRPVLQQDARQRPGQREGQRRVLGGPRRLPDPRHGPLRQ